MSIGDHLKEHAVLGITPSGLDFDGQRIPDLLALPGGSTLDENDRLISEYYENDFYRWTRTRSYDGSVGTFSEFVRSSRMALRFSGGTQGLLAVPSLTNCFQDNGKTIQAGVGDPVAVQLDESGNGNHITWTNATLQRDASGFLYIALDGTSTYGDILASNGTFKFLHDGTGGSIFLAWRFPDPLTPSKTHGIAATSSGSVSSVGFTLVVSEASVGNANTYQAACAVLNGSATVLGGSSGGQGSVRSQGHVLGFTYRSQDGVDQRLWTDGSNFNTPRTETNTPSGANSAVSLRIGRIGSSYAAGEFYGAFAVAREVTSEDRRSVVRFMRSLYGDGGHIPCVGDSHTYNTAYGIFMGSFYPKRMELAFRSRGRRIASLNYGISGDTTGNIIARLGSVTEQGKAPFGVLYVGQNDTASITTVQASPTPTSTTFSVAAGVGGRYAAGAILRVGGEIGTVLSVAGDAITLTAPRAGGAPSAGTTVALDTAEGIVKIVQAMRESGVPKVVIVGQHYMNWAAGGETIALPISEYANIRAAQKNAANRLGVPYVDLFLYMGSLISSGAYAQGDDLAWHVAAGNTHLNATGEQIVADAVMATILPLGW